MINQIHKTSNLGLIKIFMVKIVIDTNIIYLLYGQRVESEEYDRL